MRPLIVLLVIAFAARAQTSNPFSCQVNVSVPPTLRAEGLSEIIGDIVLRCTGAPPAGAESSRGTLRLFLNTEVTNRMLGSGNLTDAILLVDEPAPAAQRRDGPNPNVYFGAVNGFNSLDFVYIPTSDAATRTFRLTNIRASANRIASPGVPVPVTGSIAIFGKREDPPVFVSPTPIVLANARRALDFQARLAATFKDCVPQHVGQLPGTPNTRLTPPILLHFAEGFPGSFKIARGPSSCDGIFGATGECNSETGFFNPILNPANLDSLPKLADSGTRLKAVFNNLPPNVNIFVSENPVGSARKLKLSGGTTVPAQTSEGKAISQLPIVGGQASAVWEVIEGPGAAGAFDLGVWVSSTSGGTPSTSPTVGTYTVTGSLDSAANPDAACLSFLTAPTVACRTNLLYPFVSNQQGFDTGLVIANSTADPFSPPATQPLFQVTSCFPDAPFLSVSPPVPPRGFGFSFDSNAGAPSYSLHVTSPNGALSGLNLTLLDAQAGNLSTTRSQVRPEAAVGSGWLSAELNNTTTPAALVYTMNPAGLPPGEYQKQIRVTASDGSNVLIPITLTVPPARPYFDRSGVAHAATYLRGAIAPGEALVIIGKNFGPANIAVYPAGADPFPTLLAETRVLFDGVAAPMIYSLTGQVSCLAPFALASKSSTKVVVEYRGVKSAEVTVPVTPVSPGLLTLDSTGSGQVAAFNEDGRPNSAGAPLERGKVLVLFGTGAGQTVPAGRDGRLAQAPYPALARSMTVLIDGKESEVLYAGAAPGLIEGAFQLNVRVPLTATPGVAVPILLRQGTVNSQIGHTVSIK